MHMNLDHVASGHFVLGRDDSVKSARISTCERVSETCEKTLHRQEQNNAHGKP